MPGTKLKNTTPDTVCAGNGEHIPWDDYIKTMETKDADKDMDKKGGQK